MSTKYNEANIVVTTSIQHIRHRLSTYRNLHTNNILTDLLQEALCLSVDSVLSGGCTEIIVSVSSEGVISIRDNCPCSELELSESSDELLETIFTRMGACRALKHHSRAATACRVGIIFVNALSEWLRLRVFQNERCLIKEFREGVPQTPLRYEDECGLAGMEITFRPDTRIIGPLEFDLLSLCEWFPTVGVQVGRVEYSRSDTLNPTMIVRFTELTHNQ